MEKLSDKEFAQGVCDGIEDLRSRFLNEFKNEMLYAVAKLVNLHTGSSSNYRVRIPLKKGSFVSTEERSECYLWLIEYLSNKCCNYSEQKESSLKTYINNILTPKRGRNWIKKDWIRHRYGDNRHIPKEILELDKRHQIAFLLLRKNTEQKKILNTAGLTAEELDKLHHISHKYLKSKRNHAVANTDDEVDLTSIKSEDTDAIEEKEWKLILSRSIERLEELDRFIFKKYLEEGSGKEIINHLQNKYPHLKWTEKKIEYRLKKTRERIRKSISNIYQIP